MSETITFAVAVPVGAWHGFLPTALECLASQCVPLQVALLDASNDPRVVAAAEASGIDYTYYRQGADNGQSEAILEGWRNTDADVVFWLNSDDRLMPGALERVSAAFQREPCPDVVFGGSNFIDAAGRQVGVHDQIEDISPLLLRSNIISQPSCFARRAAVDRVGGIDATLHYVMDWDLWIRLYRDGARFVRIPETLSAVYMGEGTKTGLVAHGRLREVFNLVHRHSGPWQAAKSTLALLAHTLHSRWISS
jgi:GT2 family glycosyltransferase